MATFPRCHLNRFHKQILTIVCLTLLGCIYIQQNNISNPRQIYVNIQGWFLAECKPQWNLVFLKAHKCASSTIQNIFMRYGYFHDKIFVLPAKGNYLGHPTPFNRSLVPSPKLFRGNYNILTHHSRLNYNEMRRLMPNDSLFLTIVRNPVNLFESMFHYYKLGKLWEVEFEDFNSFENELPDAVKTERFIGKIGINQMMFDMGFSPKHFENPEKIADYIQKLDSIFSLVMVSERMDESLILLKNLLCWTYDDLVVFKVNSRKDAYKRKITREGMRRIRELNMADQMLYEHFARKFDMQVKQFGLSRMREEVKQLKERTKFYFNLCVNQTVTSSKSHIVRFVSSQEDNVMCKFLTNSELSLTKFIRDEQLKKHPFSVFPEKTE